MSDQSTIRAHLEMLEDTDKAISKLQHVREYLMQEMVNDCSIESETIEIMLADRKRHIESQVTA